MRSDHLTHVPEGGGGGERWSVRLGGGGGGRIKKMRDFIYGIRKQCQCT
jgi:hypothetical protein